MFHEKQIFVKDNKYIDIYIYIVGAVAYVLYIEQSCKSFNGKFIGANRTRYYKTLTRIFHGYSSGF